MRPRARRRRYTVSFRSRSARLPASEKRGLGGGARLRLGPGRPRTERNLPRFPSVTSLPPTHFRSVSDTLLERLGFALRRAPDEQAPLRDRDEPVERERERG